MKILSYASALYTHAVGETQARYSFFISLRRLFLRESSEKLKCFHDSEIIFVFIVFKRLRRFIDVNNL